MRFTCWHPNLDITRSKNSKNILIRNSVILKLAIILCLFHPGSSSSHFVCILCNICFLALSLLLFNLDLCFDCNRFD